MIVSVALQFGIFSLRPVAMVQRAAQYLCMLDGRDTVLQDDIDTAAQLIYAHRATSKPAEDDPTEPQNEPSEPNNPKTRVHKMTLWNCQKTCSLRRSQQYCRKIS
jgi:magnesium chelatase subunit D